MTNLNRLGRRLIVEEKPAEQKPRIFFALPPPATGSPAGAKPRSVAHQARTAPPRENHAENLTKTSRIPPPEQPRKPSRKNARKPPKNPSENQPEYLLEYLVTVCFAQWRRAMGVGAEPGFREVFRLFSRWFSVGFSRALGAAPPEAVRKRTTPTMRGRRVASPAAFRGTTAAAPTSIGATGSRQRSPAVFALQAFPPWSHSSFNSGSQKIPDLGVTLRQRQGHKGMLPAPTTSNHVGVYVGEF